MSHREQIKYFDALRRYERKFDSKELQEYKMFLKRHKDDEDLDRLSMQKLKDLYDKYHMNREKPNFEHLFKKPDENKNDSQ